MPGDGVDQPTLETPRLRLRPFRLEDAADVQRLAGEWEIAATTATIPHPYEDGVAEAWITRTREAYTRGDGATFAITLKPGGELVGAIGLAVDAANRSAELGYWVGRPHWNRGFCTEAARGILAFGFGWLDLNRIVARHMTKNAASGRVMQKLGMSHEGRLRKSIYRWAAFEDAEVYALLRSDFRR